ncbi:MAG: hypothetical protein EPO32_04155 [Anaerolineae bacterium]|nr:MAG: hypothetical protein EPO32_04155 [Anaerolineae bacterium]
MGWFSNAVKKVGTATAKFIKKAAVILGVVAGGIGGSVASSQPVQECIMVDQKAEFVVALVKLEDGSLYAIPSNALPASMKAYAIPSNAIPSNAIPSNALPASAIPSNAIPSNTLARELLKSQAIPANAIPSNITTTSLQNGVVDIARIWTQLAIPSNAIPSNIILFPFEGQLRKEHSLQLAGFGIPGEASALSEPPYQTRTVARSSVLCQGEFVPSLQTKTCSGLFAADLLPSSRNKCNEGSHYVLNPLVFSFAASLEPSPTRAPTPATSSAGGGSSGGTSGGSSGTVTSPGCSETYEEFTVYTGGLAESSLVIFVRIEGGATYEGTNYTLNMTPGSDREFECSLVEGHRLYCTGAHPGTKSLTVAYELISDESDCSITSGSLYLDYGAGQEVGGSGGNETGQEYADNGCLVGDVLDGHGYCCAESDYEEEWDSCNQPNYLPED